MEFVDIVYLPLTDLWLKVFSFSEASNRRVGCAGNAGIKGKQLEDKSISTDQGPGNFVAQARSSTCLAT